MSAGPGRVVPPVRTFRAAAGAAAAGRRPRQGPRGYRGRGIRGSSAWQIRPRGRRV